MVLDSDPEDRDQDDPLRGAEVAAVDAGRTDGGLQGGVALGAVVATAMREGALQSWLDDDQHERERDQNRDDGVERARRERQQEGGAGERAGDRENAQAQDPAALALELAAVADRA